ncbi:alpha/beta fold hydrolase [Flavobacteriaceae bacterium R38]|nr:alpha/beta fold hydrolase [Flavobacteriaceae bacterium R38]
MEVKKKAEEIYVENINIQTDTAVLAAKIYHSVIKKAVVIINTATGVPQYFYSNFAKFLAQKGYLVYTYDYRDVGESSYKKLNTSKASYYDWGKLDFSAVLKYALEKHSKLDVYVIGHSFGGSCVGMSSLSTQIKKVVTVASPNMYWKNFPISKIPFVYLGAKFGIPIFNTLYGYLPTEIKGLGTNLPKNVGKDWTRSILNTTSIPGLIPKTESYYHLINCEILMLGFTDDWMASPKAVKSLKNQFSNARTNIKIIKPSEFGLKKIGHLDFFRKHNEHLLWGVIPNWLDE